MLLDTFLYELLFDFIKDGAPDWNRTSDLWLRRPTLYPAELRAQDQHSIS